VFLLFVLPIIPCPGHNFCPISDTSTKLGKYIKHMMAECCVQKSNYYDLYVIGQGHFIKKLH